MESVDWIDEEDLDLNSMATPQDKKKSYLNSKAGIVKALQ